MAPQDFLDLLRKDLLAAGVDTGRSAPEDGDHPVGIEPSGIARYGPQPSINLHESLGGFDGIIVISHRGIAGAGDQPRLPDHANPSIKDHLLLIIGRQAHHPFIGLLGKARHPGFRRTQAIGDRGARHQCLEIILEMLREHCPAGTKVDHPREIPAPRMIAQRITQRGCHRIADKLDHVRAFALGRVEHAFGIEHPPFIKNDCYPVEQGAPHRPHRRHVHQRREREQRQRIAITGAAGDVLRHDNRPMWIEVSGPASAGKDEGPVRPHHPLGHSRRTTGIAQQDIVLAPLPRPAGRMCEQRSIGHRSGNIHARSVLHRDSHAQCRNVGAHLADQRRELRPVNDPHAVGIGKQVAQFIGSIAVIDVEGHRAKLAGGNEAFEIGRAVEEIEPHSIAAPHALRRQPCGQSVAPVIELGKAIARLRPDHGQPVRHRAGDRFEQVGEVEAVSHVSKRRRGSSGAGCRAFRGSWACPCRDLSRPVPWQSPPRSGSARTVRRDWARWRWNQ